MPESDELQEMIDQWEGVDEVPYRTVKALRLWADSIERRLEELEKKEGSEC